MIEQASNIEVVYLGPVKLAGNRAGALLITPELLSSRTDWTWNALLAAASAFKALPKGKAIGGIYSTAGTIEDGRVKGITPKDMTFLRSASNPILAECEVRATADENEKRIAAAERKVKDSPRLMAEVIELSRLLARTPYTQQVAVEAAIMQMIRNASRGIKL
nr:hypothetical protein [Sphingomonas sp. Y57]